MAIALGVVVSQALLLRSVAFLRTQMLSQQQKVDRLIALIPALMDERELSNMREQTSLTSPFRAPSRSAGSTVMAHYEAQVEDFREIFASGRAFESMLSRMADEFERLESVVDMDRAWTTIRETPAMDMRDDGRSYVVIFDMPGASASDVHVGLDGRLLQVRYTPGGTDKGGRSHLRLDRRIWLPGPVYGAEMVYASLSNGMLKIVVPKQVSGQLSTGQVYVLDQATAER